MYEIIGNVSDFVKGFNRIRSKKKPPVAGGRLGSGQDAEGHPEQLPPDWQGEGAADLLLP